MDKIKIFCCRYVCGYEDGMALSSSEHIFRTKEERMDFVKEYDPAEVREKLDKKWAQSHSEN